MTGFWLVVLVVSLIFGFVFWAIVRVGALADARAEEAERDARAYKETRERIDEVVVGDDPAAARRLLAERAAQRQRDL
jgi:uncharacterized membrane protein